MTRMLGCGKGLGMRWFNWMNARQHSLLTPRLSVPPPDLEPHPCLPVSFAERANLGGSKTQARAVDMNPEP